MNEVPHRAIDACKAWEERAQKLLDEPVIVVESAIAKAVHEGNMPPELAQECLNDYMQTFLGDTSAS